MHQEKKCHFDFLYSEFIMSFKLLCAVLFTVYTLTPCGTCFDVCMQVQQDLAYLNSTV